MTNVAYIMSIIVQYINSLVMIQIYPHTYQLSYILYYIILLNANLNVADKLEEITISIHSSEVID